MRPAAGTPNVIGVVIEPASRLPSSPPSSVPVNSYLGGSESAPASGPGRVDAENETSCPVDLAVDEPDASRRPRRERPRRVRPAAPATIARASSTGRGE